MQIINCRQNTIFRKEFN